MLVQGRGWTVGISEDGWGMSKTAGNREGLPGTAGDDTSDVS